MAGPGGKEVGRLSLKVLPDTSSFGISLKRYVERIERQLVIELPIQISQASVARELAELQARVDAAHPKVEVDADLDVAGIKAHMVALLAELQAVSKALRPRITPDVDTGAATAQLALFKGALTLSDSGASQVGRALALWGPLIFVAAGAIAAIAPALAVILPMVAGVGFGIAAIALGWKQVKSVMQPVIDEFKKMREGIGETLTAGLKPLIKTFAEDFLPVLASGLKLFAGLLNSAAKSFLGFLNSTTGLSLVKQLMTGLAVAMKPFAALAAPLTEMFLRLSIAALPALQMMGDALVDIVNQFNKWLAKGNATDAITESMSDIGAILVELGQFAADVFPAMFASVPAVVAFLDGLGEALGNVFRALVPVFNFMSEHQTIVLLIGAALGGLAVAFVVVAGALAAFSALTASTAVAVAAAIGAIISVVVVAYNRFDTFRAVVDAVWAAIKVAFKAGVAYAKLWLTALFAPIKFAINLVTDFKGTVRKSLDNIGDAFRGLKGKVVDALKSAGSWLIDTGKNIVKGLISGIGKLKDDVVDALLDLIPGPLKKFAGKLGIHSPSTVFHGFGVNIVQGLIEGILSLRRSLAKTLENLVNVPTLTPSVAFDFGPGSGFDPPDFPGGPDDPGTGGAGGVTVNQTFVQQPGQSDRDAGNAAADQIIWKLGR